MPILSHFPSGGTDTRDATAAAVDIANGKTAYVNEQKVTGTSTKVYGPGDTITDDNVSVTSGGGILVSAFASGFSTSGGYKGIFVDSSFVYYCDYTNQYVYKYNKTTYALIWKVSISLNPSCVCADSNYVYVTSYGGNQILKLNTSDGSTAKTLTLYQPGGISQDANYLYVVTDTSGILKLNKSDLSTTWNNTTLGGTYGINNDTQYVYTTSGGKAYKLNKSDGTTASSFNFANISRSIAVDSTNIYLVDMTSGVYAYTLGGSLIWSVTFSGAPKDICSDNGGVYASIASGPQKIVKLDKLTGSTKWGSAPLSTMYNSYPNICVGDDAIYGSAYESGYTNTGELYKLTKSNQFKILN